MCSVRSPLAAGNKLYLTYYLHHPTFQVPHPHLYYLRCPTGDVRLFDQPDIFQRLLDQTNLGALYTNALVRTELTQCLGSLPFDAKEELCDLIQHRIESFCYSNELDGFFLLLAEAVGCQAIVARLRKGSEEGVSTLGAVHGSPDDPM